MSAPSRPLRILLAEDVQVIALKTTHALQKTGYDVEVARDGEECLRLAAETLPSLVVLDIMMPKLHGLEVLARLRADARTAGIPVLIHTAKDFKTEHDEAVRLGATGYLVKSSDPTALVQEVNALLGRGGEVVTVPAAPAVAPGEAYNPRLDTNRAHFTLWGTRGSTPTPGGRSERHGGNTSCMSLTVGDEVFIFDAGSGIRELGLEIMGSARRKLHLFITHTHWDHIQGFPFFVPAYVPGFTMDIYGAKGFGKDLESIFRGQLDRDYFPVQLDDMRSTFGFHHLPPESPLLIGDAKISWEYAHHSLPAVGYKIEIAGRRIAWVPDDEFLQGYTGRPHGLRREDPAVMSHERMIAFLSDADVVIHEAQYTPEEYPRKIAWGHSSIANAAVLMKLAGVRRWIVTHHDPMHDDVFLEAKLNLTRQILEEIGHPMQVVHGYDGMTEYL